MKNYIKKLLIIFLFSILSICVFSQTDSRKNMYINPMITIGYSIGSGFTYGIDLTYGFTQIQYNSQSFNIAVSTKIYFINLNGYANRVVAINIVSENEHVRLGGGFAEIIRKWGYKNRNTYRTFGPASDFGIHFGNSYIPWIGIKTIFPLINNDWYERSNSISIYTYFRHENIMLLDSKN